MVVIETGAGRVRPGVQGRYRHMSKEYPRSARVAEQIQRELAVLIPKELQDPRLKLVTIAHVEVSHNLAHAKVFVSLLDDAADAGAAVRVLNQAAGYLRHCMGRSLHMRHLPALRFVYDPSVKQAIALSELIDRTVAGGDDDPERD